MKNYGKMAKSMIYGKSAWFMAKAIAVFKIQVRITRPGMHADNNVTETYSAIMVSFVECEHVIHVNQS